MAVQKLKGVTKKCLNNMSKYAVKKYTLQQESFTCDLTFYCILYALYDLNVHMLALLLYCTTDKQCAMF